ncbi:MAG: ATP-binding cassette domain-containing protein, partial [Candidatus Adiutricales bacterium]
MSEDQSFLILKDLHVNFELRAGVLQALRGINLTVDNGETVGVVGESGSGKSVMAKEIIRLNPSPPARTKGQILLDGV